MWGSPSSPWCAVSLAGWRWGAPCRAERCCAPLCVSYLQLFLNLYLLEGGRNCKGRRLHCCEAYPTGGHDLEPCSLQGGLLVPLRMKHDLHLQGRLPCGGAVLLVVLSLPLSLSLTFPSSLPSSSSLFYQLK